MKLGEKQEVFTRCLAELILYMEYEGYGSRLKEVLRTKEQAEIYAAEGKGIINSNHRNGLAADIYFSRDGELLWSGDAYRLAADWWKECDEMHPELKFCAGIDFARRDVYHFSIEHNGVM
jgi:hypothetical protein